MLLLREHFFLYYTQSIDYLTTRFLYGFLFLPPPLSVSFETTKYKHGSLSRIKFPHDIFHRWSRISTRASTHIARDDFLVYIRAYRVVTRMSNPTNNRWIGARRYTGHFATRRETFFTLNPEIVCAVAREYFEKRSIFITNNMLFWKPEIRSRWYRSFKYVDTLRK